MDDKPSCRASAWWSTLAQRTKRAGCVFIRAGAFATPSNPVRSAPVAPSRMNDLCI